MSTLLAVDPGKHASGWALFINKELHSAGRDRPRRLGIMHDLVIERPRVYPGRSKGDPNDLVCLAIEMGRWYALHPEANAPRQELYKGCTGLGVWPQTWKRNVPKGVCRARARKVMSERELRAAGVEQHDKWDAIVLGLVHLGRVRMA